MKNPESNFTMYECLGHPTKQMMDAWIKGIKDPMTDPKWRMKQRLKRFVKRLISIAKRAFVMTAVWMIVVNIIKLLKDD